VSDILVRNIEMMMSERGMTPAELTRRAGLNQTGIYDILHRRVDSPKLSTIKKIAGALEVSVIALLTDGQRSQAQEQILRAFDSLSPEDQERLLKTAQAWAPQGRPPHD
jgi:transcriptional regulator with XRE-family HTH domain